MIDANDDGVFGGCPDMDSIANIVSLIVPRSRVATLFTEKPRRAPYLLY